MITEQIPSVPEEPEQPPVPPAREMSQAAIASFFYGTLQLLITVVGAVFTVVLGQTLNSLASLYPSASPVIQGTDMTSLEEIQKMIDTGILDPTNPVDISSIPIETSPPNDPTLIGPTVTSERASTLPFMPQATPNEIAPLELLIILGCSGFAFMSIITALIAFRATSKGKNKNGRGLALTGLISSVISLGIAVAVALMI